MGSAELLEQGESAHQFVQHWCQNLHSILNLKTL